MEFRKRNNLRHPYCIYLTEEEADQLVHWKPGSSSIVWEMRKRFMNQFERDYVAERLAKEFRDGVPQVPDRTDP